MLTSAIFTKENHLVRKTIYEKQTNLLQTSNRVSRHIHTGIDIAQLSTERIPDVAELSRRLQETTGRCFVDAKNSYLSHDDRFDHLFNKEFPVTDYIRPLQDIQYTPLPDLFHEYFGHMPQMFQQEFADIEYLTARLHKQATTKEQQLAIFNISWWSIEYGVLEEDGCTKAIGAGIISSPGDLQWFIEDKFILQDATLEKLIHTPPSPHKQHEQLFVFESLEQRTQLLLTYEQKYM